VRGPGALLAVELVTDRESRAPHPVAGNRVVQEAFRRGLALATAGHILRLTPPIVMAPELFDRGVEILDEALTVVEQELDR
jgi:4-aminobutyrate aminotransferase-like enzyme